MTGRTGKIFWKLFLGNSFLLVAVVGASVGLIVLAFQRFFDDQIKFHLATQARILRSQLSSEMTETRSAELGQWLEGVSAELASDLRVTLLSATGTVIADSVAETAKLDNHADRPEIIQALRDGLGTTTRWSHTLSRDMTYVALRMGPADSPAGVIRTGIPAVSLMARIQAAHELPWIIGLFVLLISLLLALSLTRMWIRPIARITAAARNLSRGDLSSPTEVSGGDELASLARSLNQMRENLAGQLETNYRQRRTLEYLLAQLHEGVVVAGEGGHIMLINPAAARMLGVSVSVTGDGRLIDGLTVETCIPQHDIQGLLMKGPGAVDGRSTSHLPSSDAEVATELTSSEEAYEEHEITLKRAAGTVTLLARTSNIVLPAAVSMGGAVERGRGTAKPSQAENGRLLVLTDITELTRMMQIKSDFAANASHELRTPLSAIRAAVETLGTLDLTSDSKPASQLLNVIDRHSARLGALVADLLDLSRLESSTAEFRPSEFRFRAIIAEIHEQFRDALAAKSLHWHATFTPEDDRVVLSKQLLRLVLDNLIDNAIKFTDEKGHIRIVASTVAGRITFSVEDDGCGIPKEEHKRVFERFYQVGRARTGPNRGTGLGLSIVRHAVAAMHGTIELKSETGKGTRLTITVPQPNPVGSWVVDDPT